MVVTLTTAVPPTVPDTTEFTIYWNVVPVTAVTWNVPLTAVAPVTPDTVIQSFTAMEWADLVTVTSVVLDPAA
jgi:hypothetical protein